MTNKRAFNTKDLVPFTYIVSITLGALASGEATITMEANSWFEHHYFAASTDQADHANPVANRFTVQVTDESTGRQLSNGKVPQNMLTLPWNGVLQVIRPVRFAPNAILRFAFTNLVNGSNTITMGMIGYKIYTTGLL